MYPGDFNGIFDTRAAALPLKNEMFATDAGALGMRMDVTVYGQTSYSEGMFAATAATIVSGAVAGRIKLGSFFIFTVLYVGFLYPWLGSWKWGGGWLDGIGFTISLDPLSSLSWWMGALAGAILLGHVLENMLMGRLMLSQVTVCH